MREMLDKYTNLWYSVYEEVIQVADEAKRLQITLAPDVLERLDVIARDMGLKRSAVLAILITEKWKEDYSDA